MADRDDEDVFYVTKKTSWKRTLAIQALLCLSLYAAFHVGTTQPASSGGGDPVRRRQNPQDLYFMSVRGGVRTTGDQAQLLQQMEKTANTYKVKFVLDIAELGQEDPLLKNATLHTPIEIPWYVTPASHGQGSGNLFKRIKLPYKNVLDIVAVDTGHLQDHLHEEQFNQNVSNHLNRIKRALVEVGSNWHIVVGFDPIIVCEENQETETIKFHKPLHQFFLEYGVDAYLSNQGCAGFFYHDDGIVYIGNPGPTGKSSKTFLINVNPDVASQMRDGFLLHRLSPLEIESYFIDTTGKVLLKSIIHKRGRGAM